MPISLPRETADKLVAAIRRYTGAELDEELSELQARLFLDFVLEEIGPSIYNAAVADAQAFLAERVADLEGACYVPEFGWSARQGRRR